MRKTFKPRKGFPDGIGRAGVGVFLVLTKNQVDDLEKLADATGKSMKKYLSDLGQSRIDQMIPPQK
jgi:hypothetical protein